MACCLQRDVKRLVAYSRVAHMNYSFVVLCFMRLYGDRRRRILLLRHAFIRRILFFVAGVSFHLFRTRLVYFFRSSFVLKRMVFCFWMGVVVSNFSVPPTLSFLGEATSLMVVFSSLWVLRGAAAVYLFFVSYYSIFLGLSFVGNEGGEQFTLSAFSVAGLVVFSLFGVFLFVFY